MGHAFGVRFMLCLLGLLTLLMTLVGHASIRSRRFIPLTVSQQFSYLSSIKWIIYLRVVLLVILLRAVSLSVQQVAIYSPERSIIVDFVLYVGVMAAQAKLLSLGVFQNRNHTKLELLYAGITFILWAIYLICIYTELPPLIPYYIGASMSLMLITKISCLLQNDLRVNYLITFLVGIIWEEMQHRTAKINNSGS
jgi:hypothetical protein